MRRNDSTWIHKTLNIFLLFPRLFFVAVRNNFQYDLVGYCAFLHTHTHIRTRVVRRPINLITWRLRRYSIRCGKRFNQNVAISRSFTADFFTFRSRSSFRCFWGIRSAAKNVTLRWVPKKIAYKWHTRMIFVEMYIYLVFSENLNSMHALIDKVKLCMPSKYCTIKKQIRKYLAIHNWITHVLRIPLQFTEIRAAIHRAHAFCDMRNVNKLAERQATFRCYQFFFSMDYVEQNVRYNLKWIKWTSMSLHL